MGKFINPFTDVGFIDRMPWAAQNAVFQRLAEVAEVSKLSKEERLKYDHALKRYRDTLNAMTGAEQKGRAEERMAMARKLKHLGISHDIIAQSSGLTAKEIEAL